MKNEPHDCINVIDHRFAVSWNPFNREVQCHVCGRIFTPKVEKQEKEVKT